MERKNEEAEHILRGNYTVIDLEMTGLNPKLDKVIEIGAVRVRGHKEAARYATLVNPRRSIPERVVELTGITNEEVAAGLDEDEAMQALIAFIGDDVIVGHNVSFDYSFMKQWAVNKRIPLTLRACDTLRIARAILRGEQSKKLEDLCVYYRIERERAHRALDDAVETHRILECMMQQILPEKTELLIPRELTYKAKRQTPATAHQIERLREYRAQHDIHDEINWETLTRGEASRLQDRYYAAYGR